jgi:GTP-binding protein
MPRASLAIVGRPNVGKSTLFNTLVKSRVAIEAPVAGVTRDRVLVPVTIDGRTFDLIDTGGIGMVDKEDLTGLVDRQIDFALAEADALLLLVDARDGIVPLDEIVAERLRKTNKPVLLAANKADTARTEEMLPSFHALGFGDALPLSAKHRRNLDDLRERILSVLPPPCGEEEPGPTRGLFKIAFAGRRNAGKSSIVNALAGTERVIVSEVPGTTRDSVDIIIERDGERFVAIDTAGVRKSRKLEDSMEYFGNVRTERAIRRADAVVLLIDATGEIGRVEKRLGSLVVEEHKPCLIALNKWDLVRERAPEVKVSDFQTYVAERLTGLWFCRLAGVSAMTGENVWALVRAAKELAAQAARRVGTGAVNRALAKAQEKRRPRGGKAKQGKMYYATQTEASPPTFVVFVNDPRLFDDNYRRYLATQFREALGFPEVPLRIHFRASRDKDVGRYQT